MESDQAERLRQLEEKRQKRMRGEEDSEDEAEKEQPDVDIPNNGPIIFQDNEEEDDFGLGSGIKARPTAAELGFDDEDDFLIEDDLVASGSDLDIDEDEEGVEDAPKPEDFDYASDGEEEGEGSA